MINKNLIASLVTVGGLALSMTACDIMTGKETVPTYAHSVSVTSQIEKELLLDEHVKSLGIHVETVAGGVQLSGTVNTQHEKDHVGQLAQRIAHKYKGDEKVHVKNDIMVMNKKTNHR